MNKKIIFSILFCVLISLSYVYAECGDGSVSVAPAEPAATSDSIPPPPEPPDEAALREAGREREIQDRLDILYGDKEGNKDEAQGYLDKYSQSLLEAIKGNNKEEAEKAKRALEDLNNRIARADVEQYDNPFQDIGGTLSEASDIYEDIAGMNYWLDKWKMDEWGSEWYQDLMGDLANSMFSEGNFLGKSLCSKWIDTDSAPSGIIPGPDGSFAGQISGQKSEYYEEKNGQIVKKFFYVITLSLNPQGLLKNSEEYVEAEVYLNPGKRRVIFDDTGTNIIKIQGTAEEFRRDGNTALKFYDVTEEYTEACIDFSLSFSRFKNEIEEDLMHDDPKICNSFIEEQAPDTSETGIFGIGTPEGNTETPSTSGDTDSGGGSDEVRPTGGGASIE
ncbi:hypothetical protein JXB27_03095 [Candidatus Woesearchaeota archaeon]|nr:hypothetical protein [Candidatus Woesearchaeota archaeon]